MNELAFLLKVIFGAVLRAFFPALIDETKKSIRDTTEDAMPQPELKARLQKRVRERWRGAAVAGLLAVACLAGAGCGTKTIIVPDGDPIRLRASIPKAKVWVLDANGTPTTATARLEAGWYVLSDPGVDDPPADPSTTVPDAVPLGANAPPSIPVAPTWLATTP